MLELKARVSTVLCSHRMTPQMITRESPAELLLGKRLRTRLYILRANTASHVEERYWKSKKICSWGGGMLWTRADVAAWEIVNWSCIVSCSNGWWHSEVLSPSSIRDMNCSVREQTRGRGSLVQSVKYSQEGKQLGRVLLELLHQTLTELWGIYFHQ